MDANDVERNARIGADLCIVGAGPAGITIARRFAHRRTRVVLLESGGVTGDAETQSLCEGETAGLLAAQPGYPATSRLRFFGGSSNHWGGWCRPLEDVDFRPRPWIPLSGWPLARSDLETAYAAACNLCEISPFEGDGAAREPWRRPPLGLSRDLASIETRLYHLSPRTNFARVHGGDLVDSANVAVVTRANVTGLDLAPGEPGVRGVYVRTLAGNAFRVRARATVLCAGGLENARLLLLPADGAPAGVGNRHDMVGRCFMEHPHVSLGLVLIWRHHRLLRLYTHQLRDAGLGHATHALFFTSDEFQERTQTANVSLLLSDYRLLGPGDPGAELTPAARGIDRRLAGRAELTHPHPLRFLDAYRGTGLATLRAHAEQVPNPSSRVRLGDRRDALGIPQIVVDWRLAEIDYRSLCVGARELARNLLASHRGRVRLDVDARDPDGFEIGYGNHPMGTTRMSEDPRAGVVDADCRVHGVRNLYVAGSSVFPTSGAANPTLTLVALAWRLGLHLEGVLS